MGDNGIDRNVENGKGISLMRVAILNGHYHIANFILSRQVDDIPPEYFPEWFEAADDGDQKALANLNRNGVHVDLPSKNGRTALMTCAMKNNIAALNTLKSIRASPDVQDNEG